MPFRNFTGEGENDVFPTGLQFQIASDLQRFGTLRAFALDDLPPKGERPTARYFVGGSILVVDEAIDVFILVTDAQTGRATLSRRIRGSHSETGERGDYHTILTRISRAVSGRIAGCTGSIGREERARLAALDQLDDAEELRASRCVALAQAFLNTRSADDFATARDCVDTALAGAPEDGTLAAHKALLAYYSLPEMGLMDTRSLMWTHTPQEVRELARRAVSLDPGSAVAHAARGTVLIEFGEHREAIASLARAADLNPGNPTTHGLLALMSEERRDEAREAAEEAIAISGGPEPYYIPAFLGTLLKDDPPTADEVARNPAPWAATPGLIAADLAGETARGRMIRPAVERYRADHDGDPLAGLRRWVRSERGMEGLERRLSVAGL